MQKIKLTARLQKCADFVPEGANFVDIGTDHAYLPIWLLKSNKIKKAIACDINKDPLLGAKQNAEKYLADVQTVLSNGFENLKEEDFDTACIAGMGGELISTIIENCDFAKNKILILQAMSKVTKLREYLNENGFYIEREEAVFDKGKIYSVMIVKHGKDEKSCVYMGKIEPHSEHSKEYATSVVNDLKNILKGHPDNDIIVDKIKEIEEKYINESCTNI